MNQWTDLAIIMLAWVAGSFALFAVRTWWQGRQRPIDKLAERDRRMSHTFICDEAGGPKLPSKIAAKRDLAERDRKYPRPLP